MPPTTLTPQPPALEFEPQWRILHGTGYGMGQPVMLGRLRLYLRPGRAVDLAALDRAMLQLVPEPMPDEPAAPSTEIALAMRALHWAAAAQRHVNIPVFMSGHVWQAANDGGLAQLHVAVPYAAPQSTGDALAWASQAISSFLACGELSPDGVQRALQNFEQLLASLQPFKLQGVNNFRFLKAAQALDIPWRPVVPEVYCLGSGRRSRWLESSYTDTTSVIGTRIARDKVKTAVVLRQAGLPAPRHALAASAEQAVQLARQLGYPVVVKPADRDQGLGVAADLRDDRSVAAAFHAASRHSANILVEKHFDGQDYRFTVFNGRVIKTVSRLPGGVTGDGVLSVASLIDVAKQDAQLARRARARGRDLLELDQEALGLLSQIGMSPQSVPAAGQHVRLRRRSNVSAGGTPFLVTQPIHPDNLRLAERCAAALQLDLAGVDLIMQDISRSWLESGALICEVNGQPQIGTLTTPGIYADILREMLPGESRIPVALVVGAPGKVEQQLMQRGRDKNIVVGCASTEGVWLGPERLTGVQASAFLAAQILMANRAADAAIVVMTPGQIVLSGLPFDRIDVLVLAGPGQKAAWDAKELADMWKLALPHVARVVVAPAGLADCLPEQHELSLRGVAVAWYADDPRSVASAVAGFWPA